LITVFLQKINILTIESYKAVFLEYMSKSIKVKEPVSLYQPIEYILNLGGKRLRPILTLMSCDLFDGNYKDALNAALAVEMFHNFSLVHDDIVDNAPLRRGEKTVHEKWNINTGILSGDAMMIMAYQLFENYEPNKFKSLAKLFSKTAIEVCEGQQYDVDFETLNNVEISDYIKMISLKTAVLIASALKMGAIIADACVDDAQKIYDFGLNLGIAFQLQDDYLDIFGGEGFGKQQAGDIIEGKKTWLFLKTLEVANSEDKQKLTNLYSNKKIGDNRKIKETILLFEKYSIPKLIKSEIKFFTDKAFATCDDMSVDSSKKTNFLNFGRDLMNRKA